MFVAISESDVTPLMVFAVSDFILPAIGIVQEIH